MTIYIASDHAGFELKEKLKVYLPGLGLGYEVVDKGPSSFNKDDDYPDFVSEVAKAVAEGPEAEERRGIILGHSGQGEAMCANRVKGVRAFVFYGENKDSSDSFEIVKLAREHNNANVISLGAHFISEDQAKFAVELFLSTKFSGDERHLRRISKY